MKEHPILFSGPMVRAILAGRKTQTRLVMAPQPVLQPVGAPTWYPGFDVPRGRAYDGEDHFRRGAVQDHARWQPGDRLWVRETWAGSRRWLVDRAMNLSHADVLWKASYGDKAPDTSRGWDGVWRPSIFMPRWASRLTLEVIDVRVQRIQDISEDDAEAEGIAYHPAAKAIIDSSMWTWRAAFAAGWDAINGQRPGCFWRDNPWVWAITFRRSA